MIKFCKHVGGSIGRAYLLKEKQELLEQVDKAFKNIKEKDPIDFIKDSSVFYGKKDNTSTIFDLLDYTNIILFEKARHEVAYKNCITIVEKAKNKIKQNANLDMTIDNMLLSIWEEIHEEYSRS